MIPVWSSRHGRLLARVNHAAVARKIHLSRLLSFPEPPLSAIAMVEEWSFWLIDCF